MIIAKVKTLNAGYSLERECFVSEGFKIDQVYEVSDIKIYPFYTEVFLKNKHNPYNLSFFEIYENDVLLDYINDSRFNPYLKKPLL